ncbi:MAG: hypothetical protein ABSC94_07580 [Polyangiaceae bacterium]
MRTAVDERWRSEINRFDLRYCCEDCSHFDGERQRCSLGYPPSPRRERTDGDGFDFCKTFELG